MVFARCCTVLLLALASWPALPQASRRPAPPMTSTPLLIAPVLASAALGIAVSVTQYLPTLFMGAGRVTTLTTEAVTLASGTDRRVTAIEVLSKATGKPLQTLALAEPGCPNQGVDTLQVQAEGESVRISLSGCTLPGFAWNAGSGRFEPLP